MKPATWQRKNIHPVHFTHSHHFWLPEPWPFSRQWHCNNVKVKTKLVFPQKFYLTALQVWTVYNICWYNGQDHTQNMSTSSILLSGIYIRTWKNNYYYFSEYQKLKSFKLCWKTSAEFYGMCAMVFTYTCNIWVKSLKFCITLILSSLRPYRAVHVENHFNCHDPFQVTRVWKNKVLQFATPNASTPWAFVFFDQFAGGGGSLFLFCLFFSTSICPSKYPHTLTPWSHQPKAKK